MTPPTGVAHGRFQGLHFGHIEYLLAAKRECQFLYVGITNPDPESTAHHDSNPHRSLNSANPFSFYDRARMLRASLEEAGVPQSSFIIVPFPINIPERLHHYAPPDACYFLTIYDDWGRAKKEMLASQGLDVRVLWDRPASEKPCTGSEVRRRMIAGEDWQSLVPHAVSDYVEAQGLIRALREVAEMTASSLRSTKREGK